MNATILPDPFTTNTSTNTHTFIVLFHGVSWYASSDAIQIGNGVTLAKLHGSRAEKVYHELCETRFIDYGEPFEYEVYATIQMDELDQIFFGGDPLCIVEWLSNLLTICIGAPVPMCRVIFPWPNHDRPTTTELVYRDKSLIDAPFIAFTYLKDDTIQTLAQMWERANRLWLRDRGFGRLVSALGFFYNAWRAPHVEQNCLNLAVTLEMLFASHECADMSDRIAINAANAISSTPNDRNEIYRKVKQLYANRSSIAHHGVPADKEVTYQIAEAFRLVAKILRRILLDENLAEIFNDHKTCMAYLLARNARIRPTLPFRPE